MFAKIIIISIFIFIVYALITAMYTMMKDKGQTDRTVKALTFRITASIGLLIVIFILAKFGFITPKGGN